MLRSEKLRLENTGQIVCIGSPGWVCKGFGAQVWDKNVLLPLLWDGDGRLPKQAVVDLRVCIPLRVSWIAAS